MKKWWAVVIALAVFLSDFFTKYLVMKNIYPGEFVTIVPGYFDLVYVLNRGVAFGMFASGNGWWRQLIFYGAALIAVILLIGMYIKSRPKDKYSLIAIGLLWGGIAGNILDRLRFGAVVDFLSFHIRNEVISGNFLGRFWDIPLTWPAFNIADSAITIAVAVLLISSLKEDGFKGE